MKLKNVALAIFMEYIIYKIFLKILLLSYKPSNFAQAILPYAAGKRVKYSKKNIFLFQLLKKLFTQ